MGLALAGLAYGTRGAGPDEALVEAGPYELLAGGPSGAGADVGTGKGADVFAFVGGAGLMAGGGPGFLGTPPPTGKPGSIASCPSVRAFGIAAGLGTAPPPFPPPPPPWLKKSG